MQRTSCHKKGFTLIELMVIIPIVILLIGALVGVILHLTNSSLRSQARSQLQLEVLSTLDRIEQDFKLSSEIDDSSNTTLIFHNFATNKNPVDPSRKLIKQLDCSIASGGLAPSQALKYQTTYAISGKSYIRKTQLPDCNWNSSVWQRDKDGTEEVLIDNLTDIDVDITYIGDPTNKIKVVLTASRKVAGNTVTYSGVMYVKSMNI